MCLEGVQGKREEQKPCCSPPDAGCGPWEKAFLLCCRWCLYEVKALGWRWRCHSRNVLLQMGWLQREFLLLDGLTAKRILVVSLVLTRGYDRDDESVTCLVAWKYAVKGNVKSLSTKRSWGSSFPSWFKTCCFTQITTVLWEEVEGVNLCRKREDGNGCLIYAFPACCFPPKCISHLGIGPGILLFIIGVC